MDNDMKWFALVMIALIGIPMVGFGLERYQIHQCKMEAIHANWEVDKIAQVCR